VSAIKRNCYIGTLYMTAPVFRLCYRGRLDDSQAVCVRFLLGAGVDVNLLDSQYDKTALHAAAELDVAGLQLLLQYGAHPSLTIANGEGDLPLHCAVAVGGSAAAVVGALLGSTSEAAAATVNVANLEGKSALHTAAGRCCVNTVRLLLQHGAVNLPSSAGRYPLH
jgi:ankyrin repeat protein